MAKKTIAKKPKRRLKRTVRRSMAAVFMITAIVVAAIPVPENVAAPDGIVALANEDGHTVYTYEELKAAKDSSGKEITELVGAFTDVSNRKNVLELYEASRDPESTSYDPSASGTNPTTSKSLKIFDSGAGDELTWEYKYYSESGQIVLCSYNERYPRGNVDLAADPIIEYFTVSSENFNDYFDIEKTASTNPSLSADGTVSIKSSDTLTLKLDIDPHSREVVYTYNDYLNPTWDELSEDKKFLETYAKAAYEAQKKAFADYEAAKKKYDEDKKAWEAANPTGGDYPQPEPEKPNNLIKGKDGNKDVNYTMSELIGGDPDNRAKFFSEHCTTLNRYGTGYTLRAVRDTRVTSADGNAKNTYVAYGGTPKDANVVNVDGYMVIQMGEHVSAIGKHAFSGVGNVVNIVLPKLIKYIGDEAFQNCNSVTSLNIEDVALIGNRAFESCNALQTVVMGSGVKQVGVESFANCRQLSNITFSPNTSSIGAGAFANCGSLAALNLNNIIEPCEIGAAAFYDCAALSDVKMDQSSINKIGDSTFACISGDRLANFVFSSVIGDDGNSLGDRLFSGRAALKTVVFPKNYGRGKSVTIPNNMFHGCSQLDYVEFPTEKGSDAFACANLKYKTEENDSGFKATEELFADVVNQNFYVSGPKAKSNGDPAAPRESTWTAVTKAYGEPGYVPYLYYENGTEYYEICSGDYLQCIRKNADGTGTLISCTLRPGASAPGDTLRIPDQVGGTKVVAIETGCFSDTTLTKSVKKLIINDNIKTIAASTFENINGKWDKLSEATIGSAVTTIGDRAFYDCKKLQDITFKSPENGNYGGHSFSATGNALKTNGDKLTIHGDIQKGYCPFDYAVNPNTYVKDANDGIRVCYQSRWDSPESKHMTVMYGVIKQAQGDGGTGYITLLDYPRYEELSDITSPAGAELKQHCLDRETVFYEKYANAVYDDRRVAFAAMWEKASSADDVYKATDANGDPIYGPWINAAFCENWSEWKDGSPNIVRNETEESGLFDWLFAPLTVEAMVDDPKPYFDKNPFNFMENYKECDGNEANIPSFYSGEPMDYFGWNDFERQMISSVEDIVIPAGVESIDTLGFYENERSSYLRYLSERTEYVTVGKDDDGKKKGTVPGLFSGWLEDYDDPDEQKEYETSVRGNDRIRSVEMSTVKYLPDYAFDNCERLSSVKLGDAMQDVGVMPFRGCEKLINLTGNDKFPVDNGILYEKKPSDGEDYEIVECLLARGKRSPIDERRVTELSDPKILSVSSINEGAFGDCTGLSAIDLSGAGALTVIPDSCFKDCLNLVSVKLPASVNDIQDDSFAGVCRDSAQDVRCTVDIPGVEVSISDDAFGKDSDYPMLDHAKDRIWIRTKKNTAAYRYAVYYEKEGMRVEPYPDSENMYSVIFMDYDGTQVGNTQFITNDYAEEPDTTELLKEDHRPGYRFTGWLATNGQDLRKKITSDCIFLAQYESDGSSVNGQYTVEFYDGITNQSIRGMGCQLVNGIYTYYVDVGKSFDDMGMSAPDPLAHEGAVFQEWRDANGNTWKNVEEFNIAVINSNMRVFALYTVEGGNGTTSGGSTSSGTTSGGTTSGGTTSGGTTSSNTTSNKTTSSKKSSSNSSSTSATSTTSGSNSTAIQHRVTVVNGSGSGTYATGATVVISANEPAPGMKFKDWTTESSGVTLNQMTAAATLFTMPENDVLVIANYEAVTTTAATTAVTPVVTPNTGGGGSTNNNSNNGGTQVEITKPGISNKDLATANVNGSTDNFIVKITETDEATRAVAAALTNKYGTLDNILYYAMDISLYDSTGTTKITDTSGLSVDITIPIPDSLVAYGGNNMAGAVINGDQLESLNESFTTINGVPCIRFRATHFSPYTVYVDTGNLVEGMLDVTPKTGDPIHPKWFLSLGLACLSIILFLKKDKKATVKA